jgi:predicted acetyltransferase
VTDDMTVGVATHEDWDPLYQMVSTAFNSDLDEAKSAVERTVFEPERCLIARRRGEIVGTAGIYTRRLGVPGDVLPAAHVTAVAVAPTARRQGVLTRLMRQQFADIRDEAESIAVLWASEGRIYQRFGYGLAARKLSLNVESREVSLTVPATDGRLTDGSPADVRNALVKVYDEAYAHHPGWSERTSKHWDRHLADPPSLRHGATALRAVVHEGDGGVDGYALWRVSNNWTDGGPAGEVKVIEHVSTTHQGTAALWRFLLAFDLTRTTSVWSCSIDDPLLFMVSEPRRLMARLADALWLRIVDLPTALAARRYAAAVDVVLEVTDDHVPANAGRWRVRGSPETATCEATPEEPDLACDIRALGAAYLGGTPLTALADGGLVRERRPGALAMASTAFGWHQAPSSIETF